MTATTQTPALTEPSLVKRWTWPAAIVGLLLINVVITAALAIRSANDPSFAAESNPYEKAIRWDDHLAQIKFNRSLGWTPQLTISQTTDGRHDLKLILVDALGSGIKDANVRVEVFHHARAADVRQITLAEDGDSGGTYRSAIAIPRAGLWQVRLTASKMKDTFTAEQTITVDQVDFARTPAPRPMQ